MENEAAPEPTAVEEEVGAYVDQATAKATDLYETAAALITEHLFSIQSIYQLAVIGLSLFLALIAHRAFRQLIANVRERVEGSRLADRLLRTCESVSLPIVWVIAQIFGSNILLALGYDVYLVRLISSLLRAYIAIRIVTIFIPSAYWSSVFAWTAWSIAALNALGLLDPLIEFLRGASMEFGEVSINAWTVVKGLIVTGALFWVAFILTDMISKRLETVETLNSALRLLISKIARIVLIVLAVVLGLSTAGVDLTAFTVFSGAIGLGIGLGMQRTVANLVASFSLLADKSLKPGDVIEFEAPQGATYGVVGKMTTRYVSVRTRDGTETLVPNETLISKPVINWSYSDRRVRRKLPVGVSYDCDVEHARALCLEAAANCKRVLQTPPPACLLKGFGDNSVDLELRIWVGDPEGGVSNVASEVYLNVWRLFKEHDIEIPFPQRDLHIRSGQFPTESDPQE